MGALPTGVRAEPGVGSLRPIGFAALCAQADARQHRRRPLRMKPRPDRAASVEPNYAKFCLPLMVVPSIQRRRSTDTMSVHVGMKGAAYKIEAHSVTSFFFSPPPPPLADTLRTQGRASKLRCSPIHENCCSCALIGAPGEIRTPDPQIRNLMLYPAELGRVSQESIGREALVARGRMLLPRFPCCKAYNPVALFIKELDAFGLTRRDRGRNNR